jgi:hypothetical protein
MCPHRPVRVCLHLRPQPCVKIVVLVRGVAKRDDHVNKYRAGAPAAGRSAAETERGRTGPACLDNSTKYPITCLRNVVSSTARPQRLRCRLPHTRSSIRLYMMCFTRTVSNSVTKSSPTSATGCANIIGWGVWELATTGHQLAVCRTGSSDGRYPPNPPYPPSLPVERLASVSTGSPGSDVTVQVRLVKLRHLVRASGSGCCQGRFLVEQVLGRYKRRNV